jgi:serine/threonine protein kinase
VFRQKFINDYRFFESGAFREIFFNPVLVHPRIFQYDAIKYDEEIGIYTIGKLMDGTVYDLIDIFNANIFLKLLKQMLDAIKHLHSFGIVHSDIKPANILYKTTTLSKSADETIKKIDFKLCDFNISQLITCDKETQFKYRVFATDNYKCVNDKRDVTVDIHMLGATLLNLILGGSGCDKTYNLVLLRESKETVISKTSEQCYDILERMLAPQKKRFYVNAIEMMINGETFDNEYRENCTHIDNIYSHHELCRSTITQTIFSRDPNEYDELYIVIDTFELIKANDMSMGCISSYERGIQMLSGILASIYQVSEAITKFFAQVMYMYPDDEVSIDWCFDNNIKISELNNFALILLQNQLYVNYHLITCTSCVDNINRILRPDNRLFDQFDDELLVFEYDNTTYNQKEQEEQKPSAKKAKTKSVKVTKAAKRKTVEAVEAGKIKKQIHKSHPKETTVRNVKRTI